MKIKHIRKRILLVLIGYFAFACVVGVVVKYLDFQLLDFAILPPAVFLLINILCILLGLPFSLLIDFFFIDKYGPSYILVWPLVVSFLSIAQVIFIRFAFRLDNRAFTKSFESSPKFFLEIFTQFDKFKHQSKRCALATFLIRSVPLMPFFFASLLIAAFDLRIFRCLLLSTVAIYCYYFFLFISFSIGASAVAA